MLFYILNKNKTIKELRKAASLTLKELADLSGVKVSVLREYEPVQYKDVPKGIQGLLKDVLNEYIGVI